MAGDAYLRQAAAALAMTRIAIGGIALAAPSIPARPWVGVLPADAEQPLEVLCRALGGRDLALGLGAWRAARRGEHLEQWLVAGAVADAIDALTTVAAFPRLPRVGRWLVAASAAGAAASGLVLARLLARAAQPVIVNA